MEWIQSLNTAIDFIEEHLLETFSVNDVALKVHISTYHFQRIFSVLTGISMGEYIRNRRLSLAGQAMTQKGSRVLDVALTYGYENAESFSKAFERFHGIKPSQAKKQGAVLKSYNRMLIKLAIEGGNILEYRIEKKAAFKAVLAPHIFVSDTCMLEIPEVWQTYMRQFHEHGICGEMGVRIFDQEATNKFTYGIGCHEKYVDNVPSGFFVYEIPEFTWAVFPCVGPMPESIQKLWGRIYTEWLPQAEYQFFDEYDIEYYTEGDIHSEDYKSEIWIPVIKKRDQK